MPSYYTADICNEKDISFQEFALKCARAFGAFVHMRDEPLNTTLSRPTLSDYHTNEIKNIENEFALFLKSSTEQRKKMFEIEMKKEEAYYLREIEKEKQIKNKYLALINDVKAYKPQSKELKEFKNFMFDQLIDSMKYDCSNEDWYNKSIQSVKEETFETWEEEQMNLYNSKLAYQKEALKKEKESIELTNKWIDELYKSLGVNE